MVTNAPRLVTSPAWVGQKVLLRDVRPADQRTLIGFDRADDRTEDRRVGGYRHWATHRADAADDFHFVIETLHSRTVVGSIWIQADAARGRFSYGIGIGAQHRRCGYAADAVAALLAYMFEQRGYRKCEVSIYGGNFASLALHGELGFAEEGRPRDTELLRGEIKYPVLMGITAERFAARHPVLAARPWRGRHWRMPRRGRHWRPS
ncbi:GNAT family protein [Amycolatopsis sp.]|uniref:GNAT family N-acetyltransferase n=1 Tax=Amycolatopsis sp. TaxID=37632 RepID=UPI002B594F5E|nr:GNAT family protein [Amycolatopsis sp.]HVV14624.1 GNAT family protein [Amycolatopsis sp.]